MSTCGLIYWLVRVLPSPLEYIVSMQNLCSRFVPFPFAYKFVGCLAVSIKHEQRMAYSRGKFCIVYVCPNFFFLDVIEFLI